MNVNGKARPAIGQAGVSSLVRSPLFMLATLTNAAGSVVYAFVTGDRFTAVLAGLGLELLICLLAWQYITLALRLNVLAEGQRRSEVAIHELTNSLRDIMRPRGTSRNDQASRDTGSAEGQQEHQRQLEHRLLMATSAIDRVYLEMRRQFVALRRELQHPRADPTR